MSSPTSCVLRYSLSVLKAALTQKYIPCIWRVVICIQSIPNCWVGWPWGRWCTDGLRFCGWKTGVLAICVEGLFLNKTLITLVGCPPFPGIFSFRPRWLFSTMFGCPWAWIDTVLLWGSIWIFFIRLGALRMRWNWAGVRMRVSNCCTRVRCWLISCCRLMVVVLWSCTWYKITITQITINLWWGWFEDISKQQEWITFDCILKMKLIYSYCQRY